MPAKRTRKRPSPLSEERNSRDRYPLVPPEWFDSMGKGDALTDAERAVCAVQGLRPREYIQWREWRRAGGHGEPPFVSPLSEAERLRREVKTATLALDALDKLRHAREQRQSGAQLTNKRKATNYAGRNEEIRKRFRVLRQKGLAAGWSEKKAGAEARKTIALENAITVRRVREIV